MLWNGINFAQNIPNSDYMEYFAYFCCRNEQGNTCASNKPYDGCETAGLVLLQYICCLFCADVGADRCDKELFATCRTLKQWYCNNQKGYN